jgi:hypothetical protein
MERACHLLAPEDFILTLLNARPDLRVKFLHLAFRDYVAVRIAFT